MHHATCYIIIVICLISLYSGYLMVPAFFAPYKTIRDGHQLDMIAFLLILMTDASQRNKWKDCTIKVSYVKIMYSNLQQSATRDYSIFWSVCKL